ncbi:hypothetical protein Agub_g1784 [Astrephomene gubernaculifera]|uniref:Cysteine dioxygenase n=1 Tax=Astrephomene gubernaculifera TaxID=47775 RepID=A0AAD3HHV7_9CHLO|nr:hypothetical protein Agub_g1784 [Astrephomene gubernaculifera]
MSCATAQSCEDAVVVVDRKVLHSAANPKCCCTQEDSSPAPAASPAAPEPMCMEQLLSQLQVAFEAEKAQGHVIDNNQDPESFRKLNNTVQGLLKAYTSCNSRDWQQYALFNDVHYVRNLVHANEDFELIVLCWKSGQVSRVHNHGSSHCWLAVLDGRMREAQYRRADGLPTGTNNPQEQAGSQVEVELTHSTDMQVGDVGYINDHLALHNVGCFTGPEELRTQQTADSGSEGQAGGWRLEGGVTLHLYSPPIRRVKIYEEGTVLERTPGYYSKGGVRL